MSVLDSLELSTRARGVLERMGGVETVDDFMGLGYTQVMSQRGAGKQTWNEIKGIQEYLGREPVYDGLGRADVALRVLLVLLGRGGCVRGSVQEAFDVADMFMEAQNAIR